MRAALRQILSSDPIDQWARGSIHAWDFVNNQCRWNYQRVGVTANTPGMTYTRADAQNAYAQTAGGMLQAFVTGQIRRTDKGVLIEGARTNLCLQSQTLDNASWGKTNVTVTADNIAAPDGALTADKLTAAAVAGRLTQNITLTAAATYAFSIFLLGGTSAQSTLEVYDVVGANTEAQLVITWTAGVPSTSSSTGASNITYAALAGGWYRVSFTFAADAVNTNHQFQVKPDTTAGANYIYGWGAQLEAASFPSSYIPTTTASATRAADSLTVTGVTGLDYPLSLYAEFERAVDTGGFENLFSVRNAVTDYALMYVSSNDLGTISATSSSVSQGTSAPAGAISVATTQKLAARIATDNMRACRNGTLGATDTGVTLPALAPTTIDFGINGSSPSFGYLRRAAIWPRALSDSELTAVTS